MFGFHAISEAPFSAIVAVAGDDREGVSSLDASASVLASGSVKIAAQAAQSVTGSLSSDGLVIKSGATSLSFAGTIASSAIVEIAGGTEISGSGSVASAGV